MYACLSARLRAFQDISCSTRRCWLWSPVPELLLKLLDLLGCEGLWSVVLSIFEVRDSTRLPATWLAWGRGEINHWARACNECKVIHE